MVHGDDAWIDAQNIPNTFFFGHFLDPYTKSTPQHIPQQVREGEEWNAK